MRAALPSATKGAHAALRGPGQRHVSGALMRRFAPLPPMPWCSNMECWDFMRCLPSEMPLFDDFAKLEYLEEL